MDNKIFKSEFEFEFRPQAPLKSDAYLVGYASFVT